MWALEPHEDVVKRSKKLKKKRPRELKNVFDNLDTYLAGLQQGVHPESLKKQLGFVHGNYPLGIVSIDQSGPAEGKGRLVPLRLYVYPSVSQQVLYLRTIGEKGTQYDDVRTTKRFVEGLQRGLKE